MRAMASAARTMPTTWSRVTRSRRTMAARMTVVTGYRADSTEAMASAPGLDAEQVTGVADHVQDADRDDQRQGPARQPPGRARGQHDDGHQHGLHAADDGQRAEHEALVQLGDDDPEQPDGRARDERLGQPRPATALVGDPRHEDHRDDGHDDAQQHELRRPALQDDAADDRDDRRQDTGDGRHDAHPSDGQTAIQPGDADAAEGPGGHAQEQVVAGRERLGADDGDAQGQAHADQLREHDHAEHRRPPAGQAATEVPGAPGQRGGQPEQDGRGAGGDGLDQAAPSMAAPSGVVSAGSGTPSSTAVGPGSSTTASAAAS